MSARSWFGLLDVPRKWRILAITEFAGLWLILFSAGFEIWIEAFARESAESLAAAEAEAEFNQLKGYIIALEADLRGDSAGAELWRSSVRPRYDPTRGERAIEARAEAERAANFRGLMFILGSLLLVVSRYMAVVVTHSRSDDRAPAVFGHSEAHAPDLPDKVSVPRVFSDEPAEATADEPGAT